MEKDGEGLMTLILVTTGNTASSRSSKVIWAENLKYFIMSQTHKGDQLQIPGGALCPYQ